MHNYLQNSFAVLPKGFIFPFRKHPPCKTARLVNNFLPKSLTFLPKGLPLLYQSTGKKLCTTFTFFPKGFTVALLTKALAKSFTFAQLSSKKFCFSSKSFYCCFTKESTGKKVYLCTTFTPPPTPHTTPHHTTHTAHVTHSPATFVRRSKRLF